MPAPDSKIIVPPTPAKVYLSAGFRKKQREGARLVELQWKQPYSNRALCIPVIKIDPEVKSGDVAIVSIYKEPRMWISEEREIRAPEGSTRTIIKVYKPRDPETRPKAILVVAEYPLRSTRMGGYDSAELISNDDVLWSYEASNVSRSGRHGKRLYMVLSTKPVKIYRVSVSNRGNRRSGIDIYDFDGVRSVPEYEVLEAIKGWSWGRVVRMQNNMTNEVFTALILERHEAWKTCARTTHTIEPEDAVEFVESSVHSSKTHWIEIYRVLKPCRVRTIRVTNRGNRHEEVVEVTP